MPRFDPISTDPTRVLKAGDTMSGDLLSTGAASFSGGFDESTTTAGFYAGGPTVLGTARFMLADGNATHSWQFDNNGGTFRVFTPGQVQMQITMAGAVSFTNGSLSITKVGAQLNIATGANASAGTGTLVGGTATISTTAVTANSLIFLTDTASSITNVGSLIVSAKTAATSFVVTSTLALDTSSFNWLIIN